MAGFDKPANAASGEAPIKGFLIGDSGSGKTGALLSLAAAGYNVRILDYDNGADIARDYIWNPASPYLKPHPQGLWPGSKPEDLAKRFRFETLTEPRKNVGGVLVPKSATVWNRGMKLLENWNVPDGDQFGPVSKWTNREVLVIDSLTFASRAAFNLALLMNGRLTSQPHNTDYGEGQRMIEGLVQTLYDVGVACNVIYNCHVKLFGKEDGDLIQRGYPETLGKALSPNIGRYVNHVLLAQTTGSGANERRVIRTTSTSQIELKTTAPLRVKKEYDLGTGLLEYFNAVGGAAGKGA